MPTAITIAASISALAACGTNQSGPERTALTGDQASASEPLTETEVGNLRECALGLEAAPSVSEDLRTLLVAEACLPTCAGLAEVDVSQRRLILARDCGLPAESDSSAEWFIAERAGDWIATMTGRARVDHPELVAQIERALPVEILLPVDVGSVPHALHKKLLEGQTYVAVNQTEVRLIERPRARLTIGGAKLSGKPGGQVVALDRLAVEWAKRRAQNKTEDTEPEAKEPSEAGTKMALDEGKMGKKDPQLAREQAIEKAREAGVLERLEKSPTGAFASLTATADFGIAVGDEAPVLVVDNTVTALRLRDVIVALADEGAWLAVRQPSSRGEKRGLAVHSAALVRADAAHEAVVVFEPARLRVGAALENTVDAPRAGDAYPIETAAEKLASWGVNSVAISVSADVPLATLVNLLDALVDRGVASVGVVPPDASLSWLDKPVNDRTGGWGTIGMGRYGTIGHGSGTGSGYGSGRGKTGKPSQVRVGNSKVTGDLDKNIIRRYIRRKLPRIRNCYEKELLHKPNLQGRVTVNFVIDPSGDVSTAQATGLDKTVASCVAAAIKTIQFPKPKGGGVVNVRYPFNFQIAPDPKPDAKR